MVERPLECVRDGLRLMDEVGFFPFYTQHIVPAGNGSFGDDEGSGVEGQIRQTMEEGRDVGSVPLMVQFDEVGGDFPALRFGGAGLKGKQYGEQH